MKAIFVGFVALSLIFTNSVLSQKKFEGEKDLEKLSSTAQKTGEEYGKHFCDCMKKHEKDTKPLLDQIDAMKDKKGNGKEITDKDAERLKKTMDLAKPFIECMKSHNVSKEDKASFQKEVISIYSCKEEDAVKYKTLVVSQYMSKHCDGQTALNFVMISSAGATYAKYASKKK